MFSFTSNSKIPMHTALLLLCIIVLCINTFIVCDTAIYYNYNTNNAVNVYPYVDNALVAKYHTYRVLDARDHMEYVLYWSIDVDNNKISMCFSAKTNGWLGIGISKLGLMIQSDVLIGWVTDSSYQGSNIIQSKAYVDDYFIGSRQVLCPIGICLDKLQGGLASVMNITGTQVNDRTTVEFTRLLDTGDNGYDYAINPGSTYLIYAIAYDEQDTLQYHSDNNRGQLQHIWYLDTQSNEQMLLDATNTNESVADAFISLPNFLIIQVSLLYMVIIAIYLLRYLRAYPSCYEAYMILSIINVVYSSIQWIMLIVYYSNVTFKLHSEWINDLNNVHFAFSFIFYISLWGFCPLSMYFIYFERLNERSRKKTASNTTENGEDNNSNTTTGQSETIKVTESKVKQLCTWIALSCNLGVIALGIIMIQIGLLLSPRLFGFRVRYKLLCNTKI
jgi:hypothetical protein